MLEHLRRDPKPRSPALPYEELTQRELQVLKLAADGLSNKGIGEKLVTSEKTVENYTANIFSSFR